MTKKQERTDLRVEFGDMRPALRNAADASDLTETQFVRLAVRREIGASADATGDVVMMHFRTDRATAAALATIAQENDRDTSELVRLILARAVRRWRERQSAEADSARQVAGSDAGAARQAHAPESATL